MKANELMIGDWVMYNPNVFVDDEYESTKDYYPIQISNGEDIDLAIEGCYQPIPLTPEILEKNGFEYFHKNFASLSYEHPFKLEMVEWPDENGLGGLWTVCNIIKIQFVHELQHALRLCCVNHEIIL